jgi:tetratricopeptide (TPR) repeat protein
MAQDLSQADLFNRQGIELFQQGDFAAAKKSYLEALKCDPQFLPPVANLIPILSQQNDLLGALSLTKKLLNINPRDGGQWSNLGNLLTRLQRYDEAMTALEWAAEYMPDERSVWHNMSLLYHRLGDNDQALIYIQRVKDMGDEGHPVLNDEVHMLLAKGDLDRALPLYEIRWHLLDHLPPWDFHLTEWTGQDLKDKSILVHHEQGYGDTIMTVRFIKDLLDRGARITLGVPQSLCDLFEGQDWPISVLAIEDMTSENTSNAFDYHSPLYSTMRHLKINKDSISSSPYLRPPQITTPPVNSNLYNIGVCWASGKRNNQMDWRRRLTPLHLWFDLGTIPNVQLWSLYKHSPNDDPDPHDEISPALIKDITPKLKSWGQTAAFIDKLDLVVTIDTAVGHLAAAMGKSTIMLAQYQHCWRWWNLNKGSGRPWYDDMLIIPQTEPNDWSTQIQNAKSGIEFLVKGKFRPLKKAA